MAGPGLNKAMLIGHLGKDPELKYTPNGNAVTKFSVATTESWKGSDGKPAERTEWHNIVMWQKLAEIAAEYLKKGSKVYIEGRITTRSWDDKDGVKKYMTEIVADQMVMLSPKGSTHQAENLESIPTQNDVPQTPEDDLPF